MADVLRRGQQPDDAGFGGLLKSIIPMERQPSMTQVLVVALTLLPVGGILLALAGITLAGTVIGLAVVTPLLVIFSPVLVPATIVIGLAVTGFLAAGAFGVVGLSSLSWIFNYLIRGAKEQVPEGMEQVKRRMGEVAGQVGQRTKDVEKGIQNKAHEHTGRSTT